MRSGYIIVTLMLMLVSALVKAQDFQVSGAFHADTVQVGEEVHYSLAVRYPSQFTILFPDSTSAFHPFEFIRKQYVPTKTVNNISYDSVVYTLMTFEIDSVQTLSMPIYVVHDADCTAYTAQSDTIALSLLIRDLPDTVSLQSLPLKETISFEPLTYQFNYRNAIIITAILTIIVLSVWVIFGKKIKRHFLIRRLQQNHNRFLQDYSHHLITVKESANTETAETTVSVWKKYMEKLEAAPFTKLTTREVVQLLHDESLGKQLQLIDRAIYGDQAVNEQPFEALKTFAEDKFQQKLEEVKHG